MRPPKPPIEQRLEQRCFGRRLSPHQTRGRRHDGGLDLMFWACVAVAVGGLYALLTWGAIR